MLRLLIVPLTAMLIALASCSGADPEATPPATTSAAPTPSPTPTGRIPDSLPNGWVQEPRVADVVTDIIGSLNETYPDAELEGAAYRNPHDEDLANGVILNHGREGGPRRPSARRPR